jgi:hypothetical protein
MSQKKAKIPSYGSSKQLKQSLTCGGCSGLHRDKLISGNATACADQGKIASAKACPSFRADVFSLASLNDAATETKDPLLQLSTSLNVFNNSELHVFAALLLGEKRTRKYGYKFWQKVYIRFRGTSSDNYFSNFVVGRVLDADRDFIRVVSDSGKSCIQVINEPNSSSIYTVSRFTPLRRMMMEKQYIVDPNIEKVHKKAAQSFIAPVDFAVDEEMVGETFTRKNRKVRKVQRTDLVSMVQKLSSGKMLKRQSTDYDFDGEVSINHF